MVTISHPVSSVYDSVQQLQLVSIAEMLLFLMPPSYVNYMLCVSVFINLHILVAMVIGNISS